VFVQGIGEGIGTAACGPLFAAYGGRTYLLMTAMGAAAMLLAVLLARVWGKSRILADREDFQPLTI
jgi:hypothetical protein